MSGDNICDGDYIICEKRNVAKDNEIVIVLVNNVEATLKRIKNARQRYRRALIVKPKSKPDGLLKE